MKGDTGASGSTGAAGPTGMMGASGSTILSFATSESVNNGNFIGLGNSSNNSLRNTILIPYNCTANSLVFSIRELSASVQYTATLYVNGFASSLATIIPNGSINYRSITNSNLSLNQFDLVSIYLSYSGAGALPNGACGSLIITPI
jgi:hypothetical protein